MMAHNNHKHHRTSLLTRLLRYSILCCALWHAPAQAAWGEFGRFMADAIEEGARLNAIAKADKKRPLAFANAMLSRARQNKATLEGLAEGADRVKLQAVISQQKDNQLRSQHPWGVNLDDFIEDPAHEEPWIGTFDKDADGESRPNMGGRNYLSKNPTRAKEEVDDYNANHTHQIGTIKVTFDQEGEKEFYIMPRGKAYLPRIEGDPAVYNYELYRIDRQNTWAWRHVRPDDMAQKVYQEDDNLRYRAKRKSDKDSGGLEYLDPDGTQENFGSYFYFVNERKWDPEFSNRTVELTSEDEIVQAKGKMAALVEEYEEIVKELKAKQKKDEEPAINTNELSKELGKEYLRGKAAEREAAIKAAAQAKQSKENLERILKASPMLALLGLGAYGGGLALKQVLPRLLGQKPQVIAEMSFRTPLEKLLGKKLPPANIEKVIWAPKTGEKIMRFTRRIKRVIQKGGELMNMIFYGPPGTGKTMTAKALARASGAEYMIINGAAFEQLPPSKIIQELEGVFRLARSSKRPVIVFWDEADAALGKRGGEMESLASRRLINTFLSNVTDTHNSKIMFILATNLPKTLDDAVLSRFPQEGWIFFDRPELAERAKILRMYLHDFLGSQGLQVGEDTEKGMTGFAQTLSTATGRDLRALARGIYDRMMDDEVSTLSPGLVRTVIDETQSNRENIDQYVYGQ